MTPARGIHQLKCNLQKCAKGEARIDHASCLKCKNAVMEILDLDKVKVLFCLPIGDLQKGKEKKEKKQVSKTKQQ